MAEDGPEPAVAEAGAVGGGDPEPAGAAGCVRGRRAGLDREVMAFAFRAGLIDFVIDWNPATRP
ncbi:hypothetical protein GCM10010104_14980 [Streptomyces indiaensis]|uniref:Uncharacterized protein n=1 Tax=Streptomyces indiaensis TaxID=284033 RepID=A0ABP5Q2S9_9ACTN